MNVTAPARHFYFAMSFSVFLITNTFAQVGIGNTNPKSILDIEASSQSNPTNTDGLLIPRIDEFPSTDPGSDQDGMLVYLTTGDTKIVNGIDTFYPGGAFYFWENDLTHPKWNSIESNNENEGNNHYVGELYGGGIVFYVFNDGANGLIVSLDDLGSSAGEEWGLDGTNVSNCESTWDGSTNTQNIINAGGSSTDAAGRCNSYSNDGYSDWFLPAASQLKLLYDANVVIDSILENDGNGSTNGLNLNTEDTDGSGNNTNYWSSTEKDDGDAYVFKYKNGHYDKKDKQDSYRVRAIRSF